MRAQHTPGPWVLDKYGTIWAHGDGVEDGTCLIMDVFNGDPEHNSKHGDMADANRRLIAASPDMLALLELITNRGGAWSAAAREVVAKARGAA